MRAILMVALASSLALGCEDRRGAATDESDKTTADNTKNNERDRSGDTKTPGDQKENAGDLEITKTIRQDIVAQDRLSMDAKNVKVVTADGVVTLRGPVQNEAERTEVAQLASKVAGVKRVDNQLEVKSN